MFGQRGDEFSIRVPKLGSVVLGGRQKPAAIGGDSRVNDVIGMAGQGRERQSIGVPKSCGFII